MGLDHAMERVVHSLKETGFYENTIIVFTTDNGGAVKKGGNNFPLRGTKGTLYEGGTRGIGFIHSPLLKSKGYTTSNLMHAVDWLPTLMSSIGKNISTFSALDGVNQWQAINKPNIKAPREEVVYNIKEKPFMAALRIGEYKMIWGSRTEKNVWFPAEEEIQNATSCNLIKETRRKANRTLTSHTPRGLDSMDVWNLDNNGDKDYEDDYDDLARMQEVDFDYQDEDYSTEQENREDKIQSVLSLLVDTKDDAVTSRDFRMAKENAEKENGEMVKKKKRKKNGHLPNKYGVTIKTWGTKLLFNLEEDPEERKNIANDNPDMVKKLRNRVVEHFFNLQPHFVPEDDQAGNPVNWGGFWSPGWCQPHTIIKE